MSVIIIEGALFIALLIVLGMLVRYAFREFSSAGLRQRQTENRAALIDDVARTCPTHGLQPASSLVRLDDGTLVCSHCFQRVLRGDTLD
jgi:hypothetical protein